MGTFTNDSGVIIASYNGETIRFEKDGLQITSDNFKINIVSIQQNKRIARSYPAAEITSPTNKGADDLKAKLFLMLEDYGAGGGGVTDLQGAYDGGNVVNGMTVTIDAATLTSVVAIGEDSALGNTGQNVFAIGLESAKDNTGNDIVGIGTSALSSNTGNGVNALGNNAGINNTANDSNFFGGNAGSGNTTAFGVTVFSPESIPEYPDPATAIAALTVANGCVAGQIYLYRQAGVSNVIGYVIPS